MKRLLKSLYIFTFMVFGVLTINGCKKDNTNVEEVVKEVPVYEGMIVKKKETQLLKNEYKNNNRDKDKLKGDISSILPDDEMNDDEIKYYVNAKETFIIHIKLKNPSNFEIQSFTLNNKKYANYMFNEGSDMENLYLDVEAPETSGYSEYTIDAIKYIDGTDIKDVNLKGDTSVKVGIVHKTPPSVNISNKVINETSFSVKVTLKDELNIIGNNDKKIFLSDGEKIIDSKNLVIGVNNITFNNLEVDKKYQYAIVATYDMCDGEGKKSNILFKEEILTEKAYGIYAKNVSDDSITFEIIRYYDDSTIASISLYDEDNEYNYIKELTNLTNSINSFDNLLSNHNYVIEVIYKYSINGHFIEDTQILKFKTLEKNVPNVNITNVVSNKNSLEFELDIEDEDEILQIDEISLYDENDNLITKLTDYDNLSFFGLTLNTLYKINISYHYDLNDGKPITYENKTFNCSTSANEITITDIVILNSSAIKVGEYIHLRVSFENPSEILLDSIYVNGIEATIDGGDLKNTAIIKFIPDSEGGNYEILLNEIKYTTNGIQINQNIANDFSKEIFILGDVDVLSIEGTRDDKYIVNEENNLIINLNNETGYEIIEIIINSRVFLRSDILVIDKNKISVSFPINDYSDNKYSVKSIKYGLDGYSPVTKEVVNVECYLIGVLDDEIQIVDTADKLQNMVSGYIYKLETDIDLTSYNWQSYDFKGILLGNNHKISNYTVVVENHSLDTNSYGLFTSFSGIVKDLTMDNIYMSVRNFGNSDNLQLGAFAAIAVGGYYSNSLTIFNNLNISGSINIDIQNNSQNNYASYIGGFIGQASYEIEILNSNFDVDITINDSRHHSVHVGGILGRATGKVFNMNNIKTSGDIDYTINIEQTSTSTYSKNIGGAIGYLSPSASTNYNYLTNIESFGKIKTNVTKAQKATSITAGGMFGFANLKSFSLIDNLTSNTQLDISAKNLVSAGYTHYNIGGISGEMNLNKYSSNLKFAGSINVTIENFDTDKNIRVGGISGYVSLDNDAKEHVIYKAASIGNLQINHNIEINKKIIYTGGLFGYTGGGNLAKLHINDSYVSGNVVVHSESPEICTVNSYDYSGGFIAHSNSNLVITNSYVSGNVIADSLVNITGAGGFVNEAFYSIKINNSHVSGDVISSHTSGGLIANAKKEAIIESSYYSGNVSASSPWGTYVGGLIAVMSNYNDSKDSIIKNSYVTGKVNSGFRKVDDYIVSTSVVGGLIAESRYVTIENCYFNGESISAYGSSVDVGGLVGKITNTANIKNSYVVTNIIAESIEYIYIGGIAGTYRGVISDVYFRGDMNITSQFAIVGDIYGKIYNGTVESESIKIINCYKDSNNQITLDTIDNEENSYNEVNIIYSKEKIWKEILSSWNNEVWELFTYKDPILK